MGKKSQAKRASADKATKTRAEARKVVEESREAAQNEETSNEVKDPTVAEERAKDEANRSTALAAPPGSVTDTNAVNDATDPSDINDEEMEVTGEDLDKTGKMPAKSEYRDDQEKVDEDGHPIVPANVTADTVSLAMSLPADAEAKKNLDSAAAAKAVGVKPRQVIGFNVRGDDNVGRFVTVATTDGQKLAAPMDE